MNTRYIALNCLTGAQSPAFEFHTLAALYILTQDMAIGWSVEQVSA